MLFLFDPIYLVAYIVGISCATTLFLERKNMHIFAILAVVLFGVGTGIFAAMFAIATA